MLKFTKNSVLRTVKKTIFISADAATIYASLLAALILRFEGIPASIIYNYYIASNLLGIIASLAIYIALYHWFHLYKRAWGLVGLDAARCIIYANTLGLIALLSIQQFTSKTMLPRSVIIIFWIFSIISTSGLRIALRIYITTKRRISAQLAGTMKRVIVIGSEKTTAPVIRMMREQHEPLYEIVGILDDDPERTGMIVGGAKILGRIDILGKFIAESSIDEVIVALPHGCGKTVFKHIRECQHRKIPVRVVPGLADLHSSPYGTNIPEIPIDYFLKRPVLRHNKQATAEYTTGKKVLVTGAGGSIGSELCRQIIASEPGALILLGHGENSIHQVWQTLTSEFPNKRNVLECVICSVADRERINSVIEKHRPDIVFHAAAHKHVPLMESNESEAVRNNVIGTTYLADACGRFGVERFVLISTDKAADPCSIMGTTKWLCEEIIQGMSDIWQNTKYIAVRFGNVLGSRGSVLKIFQDQIKRGGPVTVTHPEMTRYFMTIPEAVHLVIQVGKMGESKGLYLLDMGRPIKLIDLAEDLIRMHGLEPWVDIDIEFCGIRPGERLHEKLVSEHESIRTSTVDSILVVDRPHYFDTSEIMDIVRHLETLSSNTDGDKIRDYLHRLIERRNERHPVAANKAAILLHEAA